MNRLSDFKVNNRLMKKMIPWFFLAPFLILFSLFFIYPALNSLFLSFTKYRGYGKMTFVGLDNFIKLIKYKTFWTSVWNSIFYLLSHVIPVIVLSFLFALLVKSSLITHKRFFKAAFFVPQITASVAAIMIWKVMLGTRTGVINSVLGTQIPFIEETSLMKWSISLVLMWRSFGWYMVVFLAGLTTIPDEIIEASTIDGASTTRRIKSIIIPMMKPTFLFAFFTCSVATIKVYNEPNLLIGSPTVSAPVSVAPIMNMVTDNVANGNFGTAAAAGWLMFVMIALLSILQFRLLKGDE